MEYINVGSVKPRNIASLHLLMTFKKKTRMFTVTGNFANIILYVWSSKLTEKKIK
ncbi:unnamed protein product [Meloidogyne enterolobii]|uniref:Uncharacterized protein n=1 Tax=Meloidogyne enterolobii TaxID=390850 RepID=A0ACB0ZLQ9_MELEN